VCPRSVEACRLCRGAYRGLSMVFVIFVLIWIVPMGCWDCDELSGC
jgi:hypothetical protein